MKISFLPLLFLLVFSSNKLFAQLEEFSSTNYPFSEWTQEEIKMANTAVNVKYLTEEEKLVIFYSNLARINGPLYAKTFVPYFMDKNSIKESKYSRSLIKTLKKGQVYPVFQADQLLQKTATGHATKSGKKGSIGHQGFEKRAKVADQKFRAFGENCAYGRTKAWEIVTDLLIDEGIQNLGHRNNQLSALYTHLGVSIKDHKKYRINTVMNFGGN